MEKSTYQLKQSKSDSIKYYSNDSVLNLLVDPLHHIDNVGFRFIVRELEMNYAKKHHHQTDSVQDAVNTLLQYVKNDSIRNMVYYLKEYIETRTTEEALRKVKKQMALEKVLSYQPELSKPEELDTDDAWKAHAMEELYGYVENDPVHQWIREISRDSVLLGVKNYQNDSIKFWINNGKQDFKRFWLKKNRRDSIGIWVQNTNDRSVRILVDDDVYQQSVQKSKMRGTRVKLEEKIASDQYSLAKLGKYKRYSQKWKLGATVGLSFNQGHVSDSWAGGGESSIATIFTTSGFINYNSGNHTWENKLDVKYGLLKSGDNSFRKNEDRIEFNTKYGQKAVKKWYYSALFNLRTQAVRGYTYANDESRTLKSSFFAPAYIIASIGMDYKPKKDFSILLSPIAAKYTIVRDTSLIDQTVFGVDEDKKVKKEVGSYVNIFHKVKFWGDLSLENKLTLYSNYAMKPKNVDVNWELTFLMPINQYLSTKLSTHLISDDDTGSKVQFKENLEVGVSYRF
ncbi:DUF3078 domain-containing protein [Labilibaculum filiforme]|nr:DUF3078 domain-containing protein [Labilibaculum filiforme]